MTRSPLSSTAERTDGVPLFVEELTKAVLDAMTAAVKAFTSSDCASR
jgi:predicted ATPase